MTSTLDSDYATLGGLLLAPDQYDAVAGWLRPHDFARPLCGEVYQLIGDMRARRVPVDAVTVLGELRERGRLRPDGYPANELIAMVEAVPVPSSTSYYAREVLAAAIFRQLERSGSRLTQIGRGRRSGVDESLALASSGIESLTEITQRWYAASKGQEIGGRPDLRSARSLAVAREPRATSRAIPGR